jgi:hypothetical protein
MHKNPIHDLIWSYSIRNRKRKARAISQWLDVHECKTLLFVGALSDDNPDRNTGIVEKGIAVGREVVMGINIHPCVTSYPFMVADGRDMPFPDDYVDFALANAIIEHVGDEGDQLRLVKEQTRVARCWVISTPNRWFPIESHTAAVFRHWSPRWRSGRTEFTRLLSLGEFRRLLPAGATVVGRPWSATFIAYYDAGARPVSS